MKFSNATYSNQALARPKMLHFLSKTGVILLFALCIQPPLFSKTDQESSLVQEQAPIMPCSGSFKWSLTRDNEPLDGLYRALLLESFQGASMSILTEMRRRGIEVTFTSDQTGACWMEFTGNLKGVLESLKRLIQEMKSFSFTSKQFFQAKKQLIARLQKKISQANYSPEELLDQAFYRKISCADKIAFLRKLTLEECLLHRSLLSLADGIDCREEWEVLSQQLTFVPKHKRLMPLASPVVLQLQTSQSRHLLVWMVHMPEMIGQGAQIALTNTLKAFLFSWFPAKEGIIDSLELDCMTYQGNPWLVCKIDSSLAEPQELLVRLERSFSSFLKQEGAWELLLGKGNLRRIAFLFQGKKADKPFHYQILRSWKKLWKEHSFLAPA